MKNILAFFLVAFVGFASLGAQALDTPALAAPTDAAGLTAAADGALAQFRNDHEVVRGDYLRTISAAEYGDYRLWPTIFLANKDLVTNPEAIEVGMKLKIYAPPFDVKQAPSDLQRMAMARAYIEAYKAYLPLGSSWQAARRWVLDQALFYDANLASTYSSDIEASDLAHLKK